jgi:hypothetical protein
MLVSHPICLYFTTNIKYSSKCSIEFDRDDELFATAGVSKRIKVFEFSSVSMLGQRLRAVGLTFLRSIFPSTLDLYLKTSFISVMAKRPQQLATNM